MKLLTGEKERVMELVSRIIRHPFKLSQGYEAVGLVSNGELKGGVVFFNMLESPDGGDIEIAVAGDDLNFSRRNLKLLFGYAFNQLGCARMTARIHKANKKSRDRIERLGFTHEGTHPDGYGIGKTALSYGLTRKNCKWI